MKKRFGLLYFTVILILVSSLLIMVGCGKDNSENNADSLASTQEPSTPTAKSWTHPSGLSDNISPDGQHAYSPQVAMDNNGNAVIAWQQSDGSIYQIFMSEYR